MTKPFDTQRFFDLGVAHIRKQRVPALQHGSCAYTTTDGLHCIAHPGLADLGITDYYDHEGNSASGVCHDEGISLTPEQRKFLMRFQAAHDDASRGFVLGEPEESSILFMQVVEDKLELIAEEFGLVYKKEQS